MKCANVRCRKEGALSAQSIVPTHMCDECRLNCTIAVKADLAAYMLAKHAWQRQLVLWSRERARSRENTVERAHRKLLRAHIRLIEAVRDWMGMASPPKIL